MTKASPTTCAAEALDQRGGGGRRAPGGQHVVDDQDPLARRRRRRRGSRAASVPYSRSYSSRLDAPRQLARLAHRDEARPPRRWATGAAKMKPRASMPDHLVHWRPHEGVAERCRCTTAKASASARSGVMSLNTMPGLGKSGMSRIRSLIRPRSGSEALFTHPAYRDPARAARRSGAGRRKVAGPGRPPSGSRPPPARRGRRCGTGATPAGAGAAAATLGRRRGRSGSSGRGLGGRGAAAAGRRPSRHLRFLEGAAAGDGHGAALRARSRRWRRRCWRSGRLLAALSTLTTTWTCRVAPTPRPPRLSKLTLTCDDGGPLGPAESAGGLVDTTRNETPSLPVSWWVIDRRDSGRLPGFPTATSRVDSWPGGHRLGAGRQGHVERLATGALRRRLFLLRRRGRLGSRRGAGAARPRTRSVTTTAGAGAAVPAAGAGSAGATGDSTGADGGQHRLGGRWGGVVGGASGPSPATVIAAEPVSINARDDEQTPHNPDLHFAMC